MPLTGEHGPLPTGACPAVLAARAEGQKNILAALDDEKKTIKGKPKKPKKEDQDGDGGKEVVPKTAEESGSQSITKRFSFTSGCQALTPRTLSNLSRRASVRLAMDKAMELLEGSGRAQSIKLKETDFADELADKLIKWAVVVEGLYHEVCMVIKHKKGAAKLQGLQSKMEKHEEWFTEAEVGRHETKTAYLKNVQDPREPSRKYSGNILKPFLIVRIYAHTS